MLKKRRPLRHALFLFMPIFLGACSFLGSVSYMLHEQMYTPPGPLKSPYAWPEAEQIQPTDKKFTKKLTANKALTSVLVAQNGQLILEWYPSHSDRFTAVNTKSMSKGIMSALVGIAIEDGLFEDENQTVYSVLEERFPLEPADKTNITLAHLMTMTAGFDYQENQNNWVYGYTDWARSILALDMVTPPGAQFNYGTIQTHLISEMLTEKVDGNTFSFAQEALFDPMGISLRSWNVSPQNVPMGGSQLYLTPRDLLAFGQMYLDKGYFNGKQIVPQAWVERSLEIQQTDVEQGYNYGYLWWIDQGTGHLLQRGYGNQKMILIPEKNAVVLLTATTPLSYNYDQREQVFNELIEQHILPQL